MKKIHITLVGGQPVPVYIGIKDEGQASTTVLVCSAQSKLEAERIKSQFPKRDVKIQVCSPVDLNEIEDLACQFCKDYWDCEVTLNLTSGTKLWSLTFFKVFTTHPYSHFIYVDQNNNVTDILTKESHICNIDKETRFTLYGTPLTSYRNINEYDEEDFNVMRKVEKLRRVNKGDFTKLTKSMLETDLIAGVVLDSTEGGSEIEYDYHTKWAKVTIKGWNRTVTEELESEHVFDILFNSGWFELKVAKELSKNESFKSVWLNCEFKDSLGHPKNEIDIIADTGNRLFFVECKTMIKDTTDIDKFKSALRNFSGTSSKGLFVTNDKVTDKTKSAYKRAMEKCEDNDILTFNYAEFNAGNQDSIHNLINSQIKTQNKK